MEFERLGKEPISPEQPAGTDVKYDPFFEDLQGEIEKLSSPSATSPVDWKRVLKLSSDILAQKSKNLEVASYLAVALIHLQKMEGLSIGLKVYRDLLEHFWDDLYPPKTRMNRRASAVRWWLERTEVFLDSFGQPSLPSAQLNTMRLDLEAVDKFLADRLGEPVSFSFLREYFEGQAKSLQVQEQPETPHQLPPEAKKERPVEVKRSEAPEDILTSDDARKVFDEGLQRIRRTLNYFRENDLRNPSPYRWTRFVAWSILENLPQAADGLTQVPAPAPYVRDPLFELKDKGNDEGVIRSAESNLLQHIFWFDLNRLTAEGLSRLGNSYQRAHEAVCKETAFLIRRLPGVEHLSFSDGSPFADPETREWLKRILTESGTFVMESDSPQPHSSSSQDENLVEKELKEARALIKMGKTLEAAERIQQRLESNFSRKERLLWRLGLCQMLFNTKQSKLVLPHLEEILKDIDIFKLEEYDPAFALKGLKTVWMGLASQSDQVSKERASEVFQRIARLDLAEAIRIGKT